jgi:hypothetical protein
MRRRLGVVILGVLTATATTAAPARAQLNTQHLKGAVGLKAGSQAPPHVYLIAPLLMTYNTDDVRNREGEQLPVGADITVGVWAGGVSVVTSRKLLGASYGLTVIFPVGVNNRIQGTEIDANPGPGLSDSVVTPISLGWHFARADAIASYTLYVPTGRYTDGATDNTGFGMWGQEFAIGTTVYLSRARQYHAATIASFTFQSEKEDSETKVGPTLTLEGGAGADLLKGGLTTGLAYYAAFKLSDDDIGPLANVTVRGRNKVFALGPEATLALARGDTVYGFVRVAYLWEVYARTTTRGGTFAVSATLPLAPIKLPQP